jgi:hypothetical protein
VLTSVAAPTAESASIRIVRVACRALQVAAIVSTAGIVFLVGMFASFAVGSSSVAMVLGTINDALVAVQYVLLLPVVVALGSGALGGGSPQSRRVIAALGVVGIAGVAVLQGLLAAGVLTFEQEIGPAGIAYIPLAAWFVASGRQAARSGLDERGTAFGIVGASYLGFPVWAWRMAGRLGRLPIMRATSPKT